MQIALVVGNEGIADTIFVAKRLRTESAISSLAQLALLIPLSRDDFMLLAVSTDSKPVVFFFLSPVNLQKQQLHQAVGYKTEAKEKRWFASLDAKSIFLSFPLREGSQHPVCSDPHSHCDDANGQFLSNQTINSNHYHSNMMLHYTFHPG